MDVNPGFQIPSKLQSTRQELEAQFMASYLKATFPLIRAWMEASASKIPELAPLQKDLDEFNQTFPSFDTEKVKSILDAWNYHSRLALSSPDLDPLRAYEKSWHPTLLQPQLPSEYVNESRWTGSTEDAWLGHGYFWKSGEGDMSKDLAMMDYDALEDGWIKLKKASVLVADYQLIKHDFPELKEKTDLEINEWLINATGYLSEGQLSRITEGGDQYGLMDIQDLNDYLDMSRQDTKIGVRMRGGGRAISFFADNQVHFEEGRAVSKMIEVKGGGTTKLQPEIPKKATGFLCLVDAFKEFAYQKLIQRIAELEKQNWATVQYYAILDTGIKYKDDVINPATGYKGDRCGLVLRQRQSRIVSVWDEVVYYSVARHLQIGSKIGREMRAALIKYGVSSEQLPQVLVDKDVENLKGNLEGDWNIQADAPFTHMIDFSHWFVLPDSPLHKIWKMSPKAVNNALKLGGDHMKIFEIPELTQLAFGTKDVDEARKAYASESPELATQYQEFGKLGTRKPDYSWSWFLEVDDSEVMKWANEQGKTFSGKGEDHSVMDLVNSWLPEPTPIKQVPEPKAAEPPKSRKVQPEIKDVPKEEAGTDYLIPTVIGVGLALIAGYIVTQYLKKED